MQHTVTTTVLDAFSDVLVVAELPAPGGLRVLQLDIPRVGDGGTTRLAETARDDARAEAIEWHERTPPHPYRVTATNTSAHSVAVDVGTVLLGGMSSRAVRSGALIAARTTVNIAVEPVAARWWDEGTIRSDGFLPPVTAALLLQADRGSAGVAASARTLLPAFAHDGRQHHPGAGWAVLDEDGLVAAWRSSQRRRTGTAATARAPALVAAMRRDLMRGSLMAFIGGLGEPIVVLRGYGLIDRIQASMRSRAA